MVGTSRFCGGGLPVVDVAALGIVAAVPDVVAQLAQPFLDPGAALLHLGRGRRTRLRPDDPSPAEAGFR